MNIIIHRYNSICEPDYIDAFKQLGLDVIEDDAEIYDKNIALEKKIETLGEMILINKPIFVFSINFYPYISMVCEKLGVKYVCVSVDCPVVELYSTQIKNSCNRVFLFDYKQYEDIHRENPDCIFYMPLGVNVNRLNATIGEPVWGSEESITYRYDISFIGSLYNEKNPFPDMYARLDDRNKGKIDGLLAMQELTNGQEMLEKAVDELVCEAVKKAAGNKFYSSELSVRNLDLFVTVNEYLSTELTVRDRLNLLYVMSSAFRDIADVHLFTRSDLSDLKAAGAPIVYHGGVRSLDEMPQVFRETKINLNPTMRAIRTGMSQRVWDVLGAGGFLLTNYQDELPEYFEIGKHLAAYETIEEACEIAAYYLEHEDERMQIAQAGYELVKEKHSVLNRVVDILKVILE